MIKRFYILIFVLGLCFISVDIDVTQQNALFSWFDRIAILYAYPNCRITEKSKVMLLIDKNVIEAKYLIGEVKLYIDRSINLKEYYENYSYLLFIKNERL